MDKNWLLTCFCCSHSSGDLLKFGDARKSLDSEIKAPLPAGKKGTLVGQDRGPKLPSTTTSQGGLQTQALIIHELND